MKAELEGIQDEREELLGEHRSQLRAHEQEARELENKVKRLQTQRASHAGYLQLVHADGPAVRVVPSCRPFGNSPPIMSQPREGLGCPRAAALAAALAAPACTDHGAYSSIEYKEWFWWHESTKRAEWYGPIVHSACLPQ